MILTKVSTGLLLGILAMSEISFAQMGKYMLDSDQQNVSMVSPRWKLGKIVHKFLTPIILPPNGSKLRCLVLCLMLM